MKGFHEMEVLICFIYDNSCKVNSNTLYKLYNRKGDEVIMAITFNRQQELAIPTEGWHFATIKKITLGKPVNTLAGVSNTVLLTFVTDDLRPVTQSFLMGAGVNYLLDKLVTVTLGQENEEVNLENLNEHRCGIQVAHRYGQKDRLFVNVVDVCSVDELDEEDNSGEFPSVPEEELPIFGDTDI